jgi:hypothetical protein
MPAPTGTLTIETREARADRWRFRTFVFTAFAVSAALFLFEQRQPTGAPIHPTAPLPAINIP